MCHFLRLQKANEKPDISLHWIPHPGVASRLGDRVAVTQPSYRPSRLSSTSYAALGGSKAICPLFHGYFLPLRHEAQGGELYRGSEEELSAAHRCLWSCPGQDFTLSDIWKKQECISSFLKIPPSQDSCHGNVFPNYKQLRRRLCNGKFGGTFLIGSMSSIAWSGQAKPLWVQLREALERFTFRDSLGLVAVKGFLTK